MMSVLQNFSRRTECPFSIESFQIVPKSIKDSDLMPLIPGIGDVSESVTRVIPMG